MALSKRGRPLAANDNARFVRRREVLEGPVATGPSDIPHVSVATAYVGAVNLTRVSGRGFRIRNPWRRPLPSLAKTVDIDHCLGKGLWSLLR